MSADRTPAAAASVKGSVAPILHASIVVFLAYLSVGMPLAVLPGYLDSRLGLGSVAIGAVIGLQPLVSILTRQFAGTLADTRGSKSTMIAGLLFSGLSGAFYLAADALTFMPMASLAALLLGRVALGCGASMVMTSAFTWSIALTGHAHSGKAMVWVGIAIYAAIAAGAPLAAALNFGFGFTTAALACMLAPWLAILVGAAMRSAPLVAGPRLVFAKVVGLVWKFGICLALSVIGFGAISSFIALDYTAHGWSGASFALSGFGLGYIITRLLFGHLPDRLGGTRVALVSLALEAVAQTTIWLAPAPLIALAGCTLAGCGFSLVFPSLGIEVIKHAPAASRGAVMGAYVAFLDIGLAVAGPATGLAVAQYGYPAAFLVSAITAAIAFLITAIMAAGTPRTKLATQL